MLQWFFSEYEDPAENTPYESAEGGYQYIWGGPYEARDELYAKFGGIVSENLIEEVAEEIEKDGIFDWAPVQKSEDFDPIEDDEPASLDIYLDEQGPLYGTPAEREAREQTLVALERLEKIVDRRSRIGIGHNNPPEDIDVPDFSEIKEATLALKAEFQSASPVIASVKKWAKPLRDALLAAGRWAGKKIDKAVDEAMKPVGLGIGTYATSQLFPPIHHAFDAIINWLALAARTIF